MKRENGQNEADDGNDAAYIRDDLQGDLMGDVQPDGVHVHQHGKVRQVITFANRVSLVGLLYLASILRPCTMGNKIFGRTGGRVVVFALCSPSRSILIQYTGCVESRAVLAIDFPRLFSN